ncbi:MAG: hypothetical protein ABII07_00785 [Patescibacteria group bacterium]|nr:hypothetical protein [Patescibacteria group bacterium]
MTKRILPIVILLIGLPLAGCDDGSMPEDESITYDEVFELIEEVDSQYTVRGSCDMVGTDSHCVDYIGSFWTEEQMELNCQGAGIYNTTTCPYSENGGCQATPGTMTETIIWSYQTGGNPISAEEAVYEAAACNSLQISQWVLPEF